MIDEYWTWEFYGYHSDDLSRRSGKLIVARCDECCQYRILRKDYYRDVCNVCSKKSDEFRRRLSECNIGRKHSEETRKKMSIISKGKKKPPFTDEHRRKLSEARKGVPLSEAHRLAMLKSHLREKSPLADGWTSDDTSGMALNKKCSSFLGCFIAEQLLSKVFKDVQVMPNCNHGFDFICNRDKKIDVKSSATGYKGYWTFNINQNQIADHFLCIAFDNRDDLNPEHLWLIPANILNHLTKTSISKSTLDKWKHYEISLDDVVVCCDEIKTRKHRKI